MPESEITIRSVFFYLKNAIQIEKNVSKNLTRFLFITFIVLNIVFQIIFYNNLNYIKTDANYKKIDAIVVQWAAENQFNQASSNITTIGNSLVEPTFALLADKATSIYIVILSPWMLAAIIYILILLYIRNFMLSILKKDEDNEFVDLISIDSVKANFNKRYLALSVFVIVLSFFQVFTSSTQSLALLVINAFLTVISYFTFANSLYLGVGVFRAFANAIKMIFKGAWVIVPLALFYVFSSSLITTVTLSIDASLNGGNGVNYLTSFASALLVFVEAKFFISIFHDYVFGVKKVETDG